MMESQVNSAVNNANYAELGTQSIQIEAAVDQISTEVDKNPPRGGVVRL